MATDDKRVLRWVTKRVDEFLRHLLVHHGSDPRARSVIDKLKAVRLLPEHEKHEKSDSWKNGKFKHSTGELYVSPRDSSGSIRTESSLSKTIVHELAHATRTKEPGEQSHSPQWKQTWLWFLEIATKELGWSVDIKCAECTYYGLCERSVCPKCNWLQSFCKPYVGPPVASRPRSGSLRVQ